MSRNEDEYKDWQERYESLKEEYDEDWSDDEKRDHLENMKLSNEQYVCHIALPSKTLGRRALLVS